MADFDEEQFDRRFNQDRRMGERRSGVKRGFAFGDNAVKAARKNHELGTAHRWTADEARAYSKIGSVRAQERRKGSGRRNDDDDDTSSALTRKRG